MMINVIKVGAFKGYTYLTLHFCDESDNNIAKILDVKKETYSALLRKFKAEQMNSNYYALGTIDHAFKSKENCLQCREFISKIVNTNEIKITYDISNNSGGIYFNGLESYRDLFEYLKLEDDSKTKRNFLKKFNVHNVNATTEDKLRIIRFFQKIEETIDRKSKLEESLNVLNDV